VKVYSIIRNIKPLNSSIIRIRKRTKEASRQYLPTSHQLLGSSHLFLVIKRENNKLGRIKPTDNIEFANQLNEITMKKYLPILAFALLMALTANAQEVNLI
jgi:hypothetical protein